MSKKWNTGIILPSSTDLVRTYLPEVTHILLLLAVLSLANLFDYRLRTSQYNYLKNH